MSSDLVKRSRILGEYFSQQSENEKAAAMFLPGRSSAPRLTHQITQTQDCEMSGPRIPHTELSAELHGAGEHAKRFIDHVIKAACLFLEDHQAGDQAETGRSAAESMPAQGDGGLMTLQEAAKFLHVSEQTVHAWRKRGIIEGLQYGEEWRFQRDELIRAGRVTRASKKPLRMVS